MLGPIIVNFVTLAVFIFNVLLVARVVMSYFADERNGLFRWLGGLTEPLVGPVRRLVPPVAGADLAPLATFLLLEGVQWLVIHFVPGT